MPVALLTASATFAQVSTGRATAAKKSIVVYFSWSGVTESVAKEIASQTGSDIYRIEEAEPKAVQTKGLSLHGTSGLQKSVADWLSEIKK